MKAMTARDAKNRFGQLMDDAQRGPVTIEKNGRPFAVMQSYEDFQEVQRLKLASLRHAVDDARKEYEAGQGKPFDRTAAEAITAEGRKRLSGRDGET